MSFETAIRIVNVDFHMTNPIQDLDVMYSDFRGTSITQIPVIRIFGSTEKGQKICLHVHGVFPYLYIPYDGSEDANSLKYQIAVNIDKAVNISFGQASSTVQHVYKIVLVSGIPFYGYHAREHQFFKIFLFNPALVRKVSNLLQSEIILGRLYQPHEAHIPYILQFMIDYNLHGMSRILLSNLKYRDNTLDSVPKESTCELEADTLCEHILNRLEVSQGQFAINPGIAALWEDERQRLRDKNEDSQIGPCLTLVNSQVEPTKTHKIFQRALSEKLCLFEDTDEKTDQNISVYPAETPRSSSLQTASESYVSSSGNSLNEITILNETATDLNCTFDEDVNNLFEILQDLGQKNAEIEETDCILSQVQNEEEEDIEPDLSMSIADSTPFKNIVEFLKDEDCETTYVPQLDGQDDGSDEEIDNITKSTVKNKSSVKYRALPISLSSSAIKTREISIEKKIQNTECVKRKLHFQNQDTTICENVLECKLKTAIVERVCDLDSFSKRRKIIEEKNCEELERNKQEHLFKPLSRNDTLKSINIREEIDVDSLEDTNILPANNQLNKTKKDIDYENLCEQKSDISESRNNTSDTIFFQEVSKNKGLTVAELYDFHTNYKAKEGCSTKFTQDSTFNDLKSESSSDIFGSTPSKEENKISNIFTSLGISSSQKIITPSCKPPTQAEVVESLDDLNFPKVNWLQPFYSDANDVTGSVEIGHKVLKILSRSITNLEDFKTIFNGIDSYRKKKLPPNIKWTYENVKKIKLSYCGTASIIVTPIQRPPSIDEVKKWLAVENKPREVATRKETIKKVVIPNSPEKNDDSDLELTLTQSMCDESIADSPLGPVLVNNSKKSNKKIENTCQITGRTLDNTYGFKITPENLQDAKVSNNYTYVSVLSIEVHVQTRGDLKPDPVYDSVNAIFYSITLDKSNFSNISGVIGIGINRENTHSEITSVETEDQLFKELIILVQKWDPDILVGYEIELLSWGFLLERSQVLDKPLLVSLSRIKDKSRGYTDEGLKITGRILLDVWRLLRHEVALQSYTFENVVYHLLKKRVPLFSFKKLSQWWNSSLFRYRTIAYYLFRVEGVLKILEQLDLVGRTGELAKLFGIQFYEVLSRGSQFRVESMMLRLAKPLNYIPVSPSVQQRAKMKAPEFLPLILEPGSKFYVDPVIVLDFQSLYPSVIIAYNYCFSTCLGRVIHLGKNSPFEFGATHLKVSRRRVQKLLDKDYINFSPCGVAFVKRQVRDGILPRMLREILETRLMVKNSMKKNREDKILQKVLHSRQLGLKLIANVTYGYTAANFSGRMPSVELGDSVVSKGRETLQRAIEMVENTIEWKAKVVYGDTDSLFVMVPGRSKKEAFEIGKKIADAVTNANPDPVKLKLEKVYIPCILQTKKRYVGYMYESPEQKEPVYDAKGIETVRRDGCPAVAKMLEKCLRLLFESRDVSLIKKYVLRQFNKILMGRISLQDLTFAKEYRGASGYRPGACVPALELSRKWTAIDRRNEPRRGERVPYVIVSGPPGVPLIRLVRSPHDFLTDPSLRPNAIYYITKVIIPPINRCFNLIGADLNGWFNQMPRKQFLYLRNASPVKKSTISQYFVTNSCAVCGEQTQSNLCEKCKKQHQTTVVILHEKLRMWEQSFCDIQLICQTCTGVLDEAMCISLDCPVLYRLNQTSRDLEQATYVREVINSLGCEPDCYF